MLVNYINVISNILYIYYISVLYVYYISVLYFNNLFNSGRELPLRKVSLLTIISSLI